MKIILDKQARQEPSPSTKKKKQQDDPSWHWGAPYLIYTVVGLFFIFLLKVMGAM